MTDRMLADEYQHSKYDNLSLKQLWACHNFGYILASIVLWRKGFINIRTLHYKYPSLNTLIIRNAYRMEKERGW